MVVHSSLRWILHRVFKRFECQTVGKLPCFSLAKSTERRVNVLIVKYVIGKHIKMIKMIKWPLLVSSLQHYLVVTASASDVTKMRCLYEPPASLSTLEESGRKAKHWDVQASMFALLWRKPAWSQAGLQFDLSAVEKRKENFCSERLSACHVWQLLVTFQRPIALLAERLPGSPSLSLNLLLMPAPWNQIWSSTSLIYWHSHAGSWTII